MPPKKNMLASNEALTDEKFVLYKLLQLQKTASIEEIKKSYRRLSLLLHPDKNLDDPEAKQKFGKITEAYQILTNPEKKAEYDQTGILGEEFNSVQFETAYQYYRTIFKKIQKQDIEDFAKKYRNGEMQKQDLINFYKDHKGDMTLLLEHIPLSENSDIPRFIQFYDKLREDDGLKKYKIFDKTKNKVKPLIEERVEAEKQSQKIKKQNRGKSIQNLVLQIQSKKVDFIKSLEQKYGKKQQVTKAFKKEPLKKKK